MKLGKILVGLAGVAVLASSSTPTARDPAFVIAVLERLEAKRYRLHSTRALLRGAGYAAALTGIFAPMLLMVSPEAVMEGLIGWACLVGFVLLARRSVGV